MVSKNRHKTSTLRVCYKCSKLMQQNFYKGRFQDIEMSSVIYEGARVETLQNTHKHAQIRAHSCGKKDLKTRKWKVLYSCATPDVRWACRFSFLSLKIKFLR